MYHISFYSVLNKVAEMAPDLHNATKYFVWADIVVDVLSVIYPSEDDILTQLTDAVKDNQDWEDED